MTLENMKRELAQQGVDITSRSVKRKLHAAHRQAQKETGAKFHTGQREQITNRIQAMLAILAIFFVGGFLVLGNIANIIMFPIAEFVAVRRGILVFEEQGFLAAFNAATLVTGYVVLLFVKNVLRDGLPPGHNPGLTLKRTAMGFLYFLGFTEKAEQLSLSEQLYLSAKSTILFIQVSIVLFGFLGRTSDNLVNGTPVGIVEIIGYTGTLVLTMALLAVTDITILFIYSVFISTVGLLNLSSGNQEDQQSFLAERREELQIEVLSDLLIMAQANNLLE